jgi:hypothetical protein
MKRVLVVLVAVAMTVSAWPVSAAGPGAVSRPAGQATGAIRGTAMSATGQTLPNFTVPVRNLQTGQLAGLTTSNAVGSFNFAGLNPGNYVVEVVNRTGITVGSSAAVTVTAGATANVTVTAATGAQAGTTPQASSGVRTAVIITAIAAGAGITAAVLIANNGDDSTTSGGVPTQQSASPSR